MAKISDNTINFTKAALENIPVPYKNRLYYYDRKVQSLGLMVYPSGARTFFLYARIGGNPRKIKLGRFPDLTIEQARNMAMELKTDIALGKDPQAEKDALRKEMTLDEFFSIYLEKHAKVHKKSWKFDEEQYHRHIKKAFGSKRLSDITREKIQKFHGQLGMNSGQTGANRVLDVISTIFGRAIEWSVWDRENPTRGIRKFKQKSRERFLSSNEMPVLFQALNEEENTTARDYVWIALLTGARKANALSMRWRDIDFETGVWKIPAEQSKNQESISLPLTTHAFNIIRQRLAEDKNIPLEEQSQFVFAGTGNRGHLADPKKAWHRIRQNATIKLWEADGCFTQIIDEAREKVADEDNISLLYNTIVKLAGTKKVELPVGLMDVRIHDLRRTLGSWQAATGANSYIIGKSLGHKSQAATAIYARLNLDPVRISVESATEAMMIAMGK